MKLWQIFGNYSVGRVKSLQVTRSTMGTRIARNVGTLTTNPIVLQSFHSGSVRFILAAAIAHYVSRLIHKE